MSLALRSAIFSLGDLATACERLIVPALILPGSFEPDLRLAAFLIRKLAGGRLGDEGEAAVGEHGDDGRDRHALFDLAGRGVERLAEFHDVDAALAQRRADRGRRVGGARRHLQLDIAVDLLGHGWPPFSLSPGACAAAHGKRSNGWPGGEPPARIPEMTWEGAPLGKLRGESSAAEQPAVRRPGRALVERRSTGDLR